MTDVKMVYMEKYENKVICCATCINGCYANSFYGNGVKCNCNKSKECLLQKKDKDKSISYLYVNEKGWSIYNTDYTYICWRLFEPIILEDELFTME